MCRVARVLGVLSLQGVNAPQMPGGVPRKQCAEDGVLSQCGGGREGWPGDDLPEGWAGDAGRTALGAGSMCCEPRQERVCPASGPCQVRGVASSFQGRAGEPGRPQGSSPQRLLPSVQSAHPFQCRVTLGRRPEPGRKAAGSVLRPTVPCSFCLVLWTQTTHSAHSAFRFSGAPGSAGAQHWPLVKQHAGKRVLRAGRRLFSDAHSSSLTNRPKQQTTQMPTL